MINVARDYEGLSQAAYEYFDEGLAYERARTIALRVGDGERMNEEVFEQLAESKRTLAHGYYPRVDYLLDLEAMLEIAPFQLYVDELYGLRAVKGARAKFRAEHAA